MFESHALLLHRSRPGREIALQFLDMLRADAYEVVRVQRADEDRAVGLIRTNQEQDKTSFCDALSFVGDGKARDQSGDSI